MCRPEKCENFDGRTDICALTDKPCDENAGDEGESGFGEQLYEGLRDQYGD